MKIKDNVWIVAVSGGSDSMALLELTRQSKKSIIVAHVNYHKRISADRDEQGVHDYCVKYNIPFYKIDAKLSNTGNFQAAARNFRYQFFKELQMQYHAQGVLVAHHLDDVLETYLMQKNRGSIPAYYGIKEVVEIHGVSVYRPLLHLSKAQLIDICETYHVPYFEDESNLDTKYTRNKVRHEIVSKMSEAEKHVMYEEIKMENLRLFNERKCIENQLNQFTMGIPCGFIKGLPMVEAKQLLRIWIIQNTHKYTISNRQIEQVYDCIKKTNNWKIALTKEYELVCEYALLQINKVEQSQYTYTLLSITSMQTPYFKLQDYGKTIEGVMLYEDDFPITIRNFQQGDTIQLRYGKKKVSRFFIDRKIAPRERKQWPVIVNKQGKVIFVCGIGCDIEHYGNNFNMFVVK